MSAAKIFLALYGFLMLAGGYMGYAKAGSKQSLIMGIISAIIIFIGIYLSLSNHQLGLGIIAATGGILTIVFILRFLKTKSFMPAGMLLVLSLVALAVALSQLKK